MKGSRHIGGARAPLDHRQREGDQRAADIGRRIQKDGDFAAPLPDRIAPDRLIALQIVRRQVAAILLATASTRLRGLPLGDETDAFARECLQRVRQRRVAVDVATLQQLALGREQVAGFLRRRVDRF